MAMATGVVLRSIGSTLSAGALVVLVAGCSTFDSTRTTPTLDPLPTESAAPVLDLQLRAVLAVTPATVGACPAVRLTTPAAAAPATACSQDRTLVYSLAPASVTGDRVTSVEVVYQGGQPVVEVKLDPRGTAELSAVSGAAMVQQPPRSQLALVSHGRVQTAPTVTDQLDGGIFLLSGFATADAAQLAVDALSPSR